VKPVLICGGIGKKMWPASRSKMPKHFLPLFKGKSLFRLNYETLRLKFAPDEIYVQTTPPQAKIAQKQAPEIPRQNYFIEPEMRNHGPAMGFMAAKLLTLAPDEPFIIVQTDVIRQPPKKFIEMIEECDFLVKKEGKLITGGIRPKYAVMGVDYLIASLRPKRSRGMMIYQMEKWLGRDTKERVEKYLQRKAVFLHANHYSWTPRLLLAAYQKHAPEWYRPLQKIIRAFGKQGEKKKVAQEYARMPADGVERVTRHELVNGYVIEVPFEWIDFGTWESLALFMSQKGGGHKNLFEADAENCFLQVPPHKFVALIGVKDLVIVDTADALLVCRRDQSGRVGEVVEYLRQKNKGQWL